MEEKFHVHLFLKVAKQFFAELSYLQMIGQIVMHTFRNRGRKARRLSVVRRKSLTKAS